MGREASTITAVSFARRECIKEKMLAEQHERRQAFMCAKQDRLDRWAQKTAASPFHKSLWVEHVRTRKSNQEVDAKERIRVLQAAQRERTVHAAALSGMLLEVDAKEVERKSRQSKMQTTRVNLP